MRCLHPIRPRASRCGRLPPPNRPPMRAQEEGAARGKPGPKRALGSSASRGSRWGYNVPLPWRAERDIWEGAARAGGAAAEHAAGWASPSREPLDRGSARGACQ